MILHGDAGLKASMHITCFQRFEKSEIHNHIMTAKIALAALVGFRERNKGTKGGGERDIG
jgi:hypothetical protein